MKLAHLHLKDPFGNLSTLICRLEDGSIQYRLWTGIQSSGMGESLSNLQANLPVEKANKNETKEEFVKRLINIINTKSVRTVINQVEEVSF